MYIYIYIYIYIYMNRQKIKKGGGRTETFKKRISF